MKTPQPAHAHAHPHLLPTTLSTPLPGPASSLEDIQMTLREAILAGDRVRSDVTGSRLLAMGDRAVGTNHTRLILIVAAARSATVIVGPADLPDYWQVLGPAITMLQIETELHRKPGALAQSFDNALAFVDDAHADAVSRLASGSKHMAPQIARLSAVRDLPAASRLAWHGVDLSSDVPRLYGEAKLNAEYRHHHSRVVAYERGKQALARNPRWCACINTFSATCRELGRRDEAVSWVARSMAIEPNVYAANTMWKIGDDFGVTALSELGRFILVMCENGRSHSERQRVVVKALAEAGLRAEVEAALDRPTGPTRLRLAMRSIADTSLLSMAV